MSEKQSIPMFKVKSSNLDYIGHDGKETLYIKFKSGANYKYSPFSKERFEEFKSSSSKGSYFINEIKDDSSLEFETV